MPSENVNIVQLIMYGGAVVVLSMLVQWAVSGKIWFRVAVDAVIVVLKERLTRSEKQTDEIIPILQAMVATQATQTAALHDLKDLLTVQHTQLLAAIESRSPRRTRLLPPRDREQAV